MRRCGGRRTGEEVVHEWIRRLVTEPAGRRWRRCLGGPLQHDARIGDQEDAGELVGDHHDRNPEIAAEQGDQLIQFDGRDRVEAGGGLVEEEEVGLQHQGARDAGPLLHAARDLGGQVFRERAEAHEIQLGLDEIRTMGPRSDPRLEGSARFSASVRELKSAPDWNSTPNGERPRRARLADSIDLDPAVLGTLEANQMAQQRALAAARAAENREDRAARNAERHVFHQHPRAPADAEILDGDVRLRRGGWRGHLRFP